MSRLSGNNAISIAIGSVDNKFKIVDGGVDNELSMICEVQLILNQYLHEKKRLHKLYSILRDRAFFEMVTKEDAQEQEETVMDIKKLQFEPVLNVKEHAQLSYSGTDFFKCSVEPDLRLLGMNCNWNQRRFLCVDMSTMKEIFKHSAHEHHSHHWLQHQGQKYLSLQTDNKTVKMFQIDEETKTFNEDESLMMCASEDDEINATEFDHTFEHIFILKNAMVFEKRRVGDSSDVTLTLQLEEKVQLGKTGSHKYGDIERDILTITSDVRRCCAAPLLFFCDVDLCCCVLLVC